MKKIKENIEKSYKIEKDLIIKIDHYHKEWFKVTRKGVLKVLVNFKEYAQELKNIMIDVEFTNQ